MEKKNVPKIRFPGFTEPWEQRKLGDYLIQYTEVTTKNNQYPVLTSSRKGIFFQKDYYDGNQIASQDNTGYNIVPFGYFTYRHMSDDEIFRFNINNIVENGIVSTLYPVFTTNDKLDSKYLQYQLNYGREFKRYAILQKQGGSRTYMYFNKLKELILTLPPSVEEQEKISNFFEKLDNLISLHQRKLENLKKQKKGLLQKMFPEKGKKVPEIRFPEFTDDWEQRKLGEIADITKLAGFEFTEHVVYSEQGKIIALRGLNVKNGKLVLDDVKYIDESNFSKLKRSKLYIDDILFTYVGTVGEVAIINENDKFYLAPNVARIRVNSDDLPQYISQYMRSNNFYNSVILPLIATSSQPALSMENIRKFNIYLPQQKEEQIKIGQLFDKVDNLISLHQRKLEHLQKQKKALLQQMFV